MKQGRLAWTVAVSLALHLVLGWLVSRRAAEVAPRHALPQRSTFELRSRPASESVAQAKPPAPERVKAPRVRVDSPTRSRVDPPTHARVKVPAVTPEKRANLPTPAAKARSAQQPPAAVATGRRGAGPRRVSLEQLFNVSPSAGSIAEEEALGDPGADEEGLGGAALAQHRLIGWATEKKIQSQANHGIDAQLFALGRSAAERLSLQQEIFAEHVMWRDQRFRIGPLVGGQAKLPCFGACLAGPEVRGISVGIALEHDAQGVPTRASIALPSRRRDFDEGAHLALLQAVGEHPSALNTRRGPVRKTCWLMAGHVYHWDRKSLLLDPQFRPPGNTVEGESGLITRATVASSVWLIGVIDDTDESRCF